jgi:hypothetical protein
MISVQSTPVVLARWKIVLIAALMAVAGALTAYLPSLVQDLRFLHQARVYSEFAAQQQQQAPRPSQGTVVPGPPPATDSPPKK